MTAPDAAEAAPAANVVPLAVVRGEPQFQLPKDLYIPPDALEVFLEAFEGPLDLLLYLIRKQNLDILEIPIARITEQYMRYIALMQELRLELAAEYLVMAAMLAEIKSRMLLPRHESAEEDEIDPRAELIRRLQEYERFKLAAEALDALPRSGRDTFGAEVAAPPRASLAPLPEVELDALLQALQDVLRRADLFTSHHVTRESLSLRERMTQVLERLSAEHFTAFSAFFDVSEGRAGVVVSFMAVLELLKQGLIQIVQAEPMAPIHVKAAGRE